ncbi:bifunctional DNA primase/polymerase [Solihabitans fulvus]|uniref:Bifunctional DNA primase/polymerase n=1 Tax=Solihabitans fulvus TaxID=1892852 RepID=A0A5B2WKK3_9PSEU|nr:bifunctional DNA primase/polymerase [Solihabitans fulvus]KAA2252351.1 bifunctional DNA primase/polymerase [Solihabitans fulvus]
MATNPPTPTTRRLLRAALEAADRGWHVFPLRPRGKRPALRDWEHHATTDHDILTTWWATTPHNIAVATGPSSLVVVDLDAAHGQQPPPEWAALGVTHGSHVLAVLAHRADAPPSIATYTVATPTGGLHLYFTAPQNPVLRNTVSTLGWHVDTRAAGGYVVAAGSTGGQGRYTVTDPSPVAPLPGWLVTALTPPPVTAHANAPAGNAGAYLRAIIDGETRRVARAVPGTRNQELFKAAATLGNLVAGGELDDATALSTLRRAAAIHIGVNDFTHAEMDRTIDSGLRRGSQHPRTLS